MPWECSTCGEHKHGNTASEPVPYYCPNGCDSPLTRMLDAAIRDERCPSHGQTYRVTPRCAVCARILDALTAKVFAEVTK